MTAYHMALIQKFGLDFARTMMSDIMSEANEKTTTGSSYKISDSMREALIIRAASWREAIILYEHLEKIGGIEKVPCGLKEI